MDPSKASIAQEIISQAALLPTVNTMTQSDNMPCIKIIEQPANKGLRFRYECEGRSAGSIPGVHSTPDNRTYPTIEIVGFSGKAVVVVSCVTKDPPYKPHPHKLVGKEGCKRGICTVKLCGEVLREVFNNLGIQCVKKKDVKAALEERQKQNVDPFKTKFDHKSDPSTIDFNVVRLCFQAFLEIGEQFKPLKPVVSDPIYDKKSLNDLVICRLCSCSAKVGGGDEIILLCEKVNKDDIKVRFFELNNEHELVWEDFAQFQQKDVHKQVGIVIKTPRYYNTNIQNSAKVWLQLVRPSDGVTSEPLEFEYYADPDQIKRKRAKIGNSMNILKKKLLQEHPLPKGQAVNGFNKTDKDDANTNANIWNIPQDSRVKPEPVITPPLLGLNPSPPHQHISPEPHSLSPMHCNTTLSPSLTQAFSNSSIKEQNNLLDNEMLPQQLQQLQQQQEQPTYHELVSSSNQFNCYNTNMTAMGYAAAMLESQKQQQQQQQQQQFYKQQQSQETQQQPSYTELVNSNNPYNWYHVNGIPAGNPFFEHLVPATYNTHNINAGMMTSNMPLAKHNMNLHAANMMKENTANNYLNYQNQQMQQPQQLQQLQQTQLRPQQQSTQQLLPNDIQTAPPNTPTDTVGPTLSGLITFLEKDQLMNINSSDLRNITLST